MSGIDRMTSTGLVIDLGTSRTWLSVPEQRDGEHLWVATAAWRISDPASDQFQLDTENLLTVVGPGCFYCEQAYTSRLALRRCKGAPS